MAKDNQYYLRKIIGDAIADGWTITARVEDEVDYRGTDKRKALDALTACDEMLMVLTKEVDGVTLRERVFIVNDISNEPEEIIANYALTKTGWVDAWWNQNIGAAA
ncbi:hypothetical protein H7H48_15790 [Nitratireductor sp. B36]|uniref:hypothetical protein n=1 Tax=Nitratireductor sp. B36 TaxID=2762059 RepID=UPI001E4B2B6E|nr:hypothetical protein [Nitratireductor sp. B36]MCC5780523.1 hypothetical protein [Nitratireductor sp. B36]